MKFFSALLPLTAAALLALSLLPATAQEADLSVPVAASAVEPSGAPSLLPTPETVGVPAFAPAGLSIPSSARTVNQVQTHTGWVGVHDKGTSGTASGTSTLLSSPALSGRSQKHFFSFTHYGGERWSVKFGSDANAKNFLYSAYVYIVRGASNLANIEMDMNQVMPNGQTVIFGFQCDGWSNTWDFTAGKGWSHSSHFCDPTKWALNKWHHVQISYSRNGSGDVTYHAVWLDGVKTAIGATVHSARSMGWQKGSLVTNFQLGGANSTSGSATVYVDKLTVTRW